MKPTDFDGHSDFLLWCHLEVDIVGFQSEIGNFAQTILVPRKLILMALEIP